MPPRSIQSFERRKAKYKPVPKILVLCEDSKSSLSYLNDACEHYRIRVDVEIAHCGKTDPLGIVKVAIDRQRAYEQVYCVIDRDRHKNFDDGCRLAMAHEKIGLIVSYPCFEYWYLLHFGYTRSPYAEEGSLSPADVLIRDLRKQHGFDRYAKGGKENLFLRLQRDRLPVAKANSVRALAEAERDQDFNPSTAVHLLIEQFEHVSQLQPA